jgi:hypothetical protein
MVMQEAIMPIAECFASIRAKAGVTGVSGVTSYTSTPCIAENVLPAAPRKVEHFQSHDVSVTPETPATPDNDDAYWQEMYEERAAIMEYDGGLSRDEAEQQAKQLVDAMRCEKASQ